MDLYEQPGAQVTQHATNANRAMSAIAQKYAGGSSCALMPLKIWEKNVPPANAVPKPVAVPATMNDSVIRLSGERFIRLLTSSRKDMDISFC